jgi:type I restriction enzyme R subunit
MTTDISEKGLEALIVTQMTNGRGAPPELGGFAEEPEPFVGLANWLLGDPRDYDRGWTVGIAQLRAFLTATQPLLPPALDLDVDSPARQKIPRPASRRDRQARRHRCVAPRHPARAP